MADLRTDFVDDVLDTAANLQRKYNLIENEDGTVSFEDVTVYLTTGDNFGANMLNEICAEINETKKLSGDGKTLVADAITAKGVETATDATFEVMAENITSMAEVQFNAGKASFTPTAQSQYKVLSGSGSQMVTFTFTFPTKVLGVASAYIIGIQNNYNYTAANSIGAYPIVWSISGNTLQMKVCVGSGESISWGTNYFKLQVTVWGY